MTILRAEGWVTALLGISRSRSDERQHTRGAESGREHFPVLRMFVCCTGLIVTALTVGLAGRLLQWFAGGA